MVRSWAIVMDCLRQDLEREKAKHIQLFTTLYQGRKAILVTSLDTDRLREKFNDIADDYCETLHKVAETRTTQTYAI